MMQGLAGSSADGQKSGIVSDMASLTVDSINANGELGGSSAAPADGGYPDTGPVHGFIAKH